MIFRSIASNIAKMAVAKESQLERIERLFARAIARGDFESEAQILEMAELSSGWLSQKRNEFATTGRSPGISGKTARLLATVLKTTVAEVLGEEPSPPDDDVDPERSWAVAAARLMQHSEDAIRIVQAEPPGQSRWYWYRRIEAEDERLSPAARR